MVLGLLAGACCLSMPCRMADVYCLVVGIIWRSGLRGALTCGKEGHTQVVKRGGGVDGIITRRGQDGR